MTTEPDSSDDPALPEIDLLNPNRYAPLGTRRLRPWLRAVVASLAPAADSLAVRFVSDREMRRLNRRYRRRDRPTDVLSFAGDLADGGDLPRVPGMPRHLGDVVVSIPTARRQAAARGHGVERELRLLLLHGVLHCLGYDHETDGGTMARLERRLRKRLIDDV